jgi:putative spermidine/putrescine transport system ATP-binding protein
LSEPVGAVAAFSLEPVTISLRQLTKRFGAVMAVDHLDLDVRSGEFLTLLGASGSGKSTTLQMIAGFERPTSGDIHLSGQSMAGVPPHKRKIGVVFQNYALFPHLNVFENVAFALRNLRWTRRQIGTRVAELLDLVDLNGLDSRLPSQLSGGQQQRVAIARALAFNPMVLLLDEPLGALDKQLRQQMLRELRRLHKILGVTMLYVTHDQEEALAMSDRIAVMDHGRLLAIGTPQQLYETPALVSVAQFIGDTNVLRGIATSAHEICLEGVTLPVAGVLQPGAEIKAGLRPERIALLDEGDARVGYVTGRARLEDAMYLGETSRYTLTTETGTTLLVKAPNTRASRSHRAGDYVTFGWDPNDLQILRD